ncbi:C6 transcription factor [Colletotrichum higginsianum]|nr:C6 transcription factor [Colletotrichum higginsianum]
MNPLETEHEPDGTRLQNARQDDAENKQPGQRVARGFRRTYKACNPCRRKKTRCVVEIRDSPSCLRCDREGRECVFPPDRAASSQKNAAADALAQGRGGPASEGTSLAGQPGTPQPRSRDGYQHRRPQGSQRHALPRNPSPTVPPPFEQWDPMATENDNSFNTRCFGQAGGVSPGLEPVDLTNSMIRTIVSNGNDALKLLFRAAAEQEAPGSGAAAPRVPSHASTSTLPSEPGNPASAPPAMSVLQLWNAFRFVKMGWFTAEEGVRFVDLFFRNLAPLSLIARGMDATHQGHFRLTAKEPLLCCVILLISTRYHHLPQPGGVARGVLVHNRLWEHCQHLIMRIITGQEKGSTARTRTRGSVEALLLLVEWHPRAVYFPPVPDGWDSSLLHSAFELGRTDDYGTREHISDESSGPAWQRDVVTPARTSDRMAWMLLGNAQTLALELGIYDTASRADAGVAHARQPGLHARSARVREVLYILMEQHSFRLGCPSMVPDTLTRSVTGYPSANDGGGGGGGDDDEDSRVARAWIGLTMLVRSIHDMLFPTAGAVRHLLRTGRYASITRHFQQQLVEWRRKHLDSTAISPNAIEELHIEYHHAQAFLNSLGVQAIVERVMGSASASPTIRATLNSTVQGVEYDFIKKVVDGSVQVLRATQRLFVAGLLRYCPVRIYLRVIAASIFLLKALSLGTHAADLRSSLGCLHECIACLKASSLDDGDLAARYAALLEVFLAKFEQGMVPTSAPRISSMLLGQGELSVDDSGEGLGGADEGWDDVPEDWLALPLSHSLAPFQLWGEAPETMEPEVSFWDAMWNLPQV